MVRFGGSLHGRMARGSGDSRVVSGSFWVVSDGLLF